MEEFIYLSQLVQADAMSVAYKSWRERWGTLHGRSCGGVLVWQMNDCWPVTSWSICDFHARPKASFYSIARALAPIILSARRFTTGRWTDPRVDALAKSKTIKGSAMKKLHSVPHTYPPIQSKVRISLSSIDHRDRAGLKIEIKYVNIATGEAKTVFSRDGATSKANETDVLYEADVPEDVPTLVYATAVDVESGDIVARETDWPQPLRYVVFPDRGVRVAVHSGSSDGEKIVKVTVEKPVKALWFDEKDGESWSDNSIDVSPGETVKLTVKGWAQHGELSWRAYGVDK